jgi:hypothetical protein
MHDIATHFLSAVMVVIGVALLVKTIAIGGGSFGYIISVLFIAAGAGRMYVQRKIR